MPATFGHFGLAAELALGAHLARHAGDLVGEDRQRVGHLVDRVGQLGDLALGLDRDLLGQVAARPPPSRPGRCCAPGSVRLDAMRFTESVRSFQVPATFGHLGLAAELAVGAHLARHARDLLGEDRQRVGHRVDRVGQLGHLALGLDGDLLRQVAAGHRLVETWAMLRTWSVRFEAMKFTESVRSRQVPETPLTSAWPPSLPSVPTSRATRVTSVGERGRAGRPSC